MAAKPISNTPSTATTPPATSTADNRVSSGQRIATDANSTRRNPRRNRTSDVRESPIDVIGMSAPGLFAATGNHAPDGARRRESVVRDGIRDVLGGDDPAKLI